jgi:hypothetical protein
MRTPARRYEHGVGIRRDNLKVMRESDGRRAGEERRSPDTESAVVDPPRRLLR